MVRRRNKTLAFDALNLDMSPNRNAICVQVTAPEHRPSTSYRIQPPAESPEFPQAVGSKMHSGFLVHLQYLNAPADTCDILEVTYMFTYIHS